MPSGVGVPKFVEEPAGAVGTVRASIDLDGSILKPMFYDAMTAVQFGAVRNCLELFEHCAVRSATRAGEQWGVRACVLGPKSLKHRNQFLRNRYFPFLPIL